MKPEKYARVVARRRVEKYGENYRVALSKARAHIERKHSKAAVVMSLVCLSWSCAALAGTLIT